MIVSGADLKDLIAEKFDSTAGLLKLICKGKVVQNDQSLNSQNIQVCKLHHLSSFIIIPTTFLYILAFSVCLSRLYSLIIREEMIKMHGACDHFFPQ